MCAAAKSVSYVLPALIARGGESMKSFGGIRERERCKALIFAKRNIAFVCGRDIHFLTRFFRIFDTDRKEWDYYEAFMSVSKELTFAKRNTAYVCCRKINFANRLSIVFDTKLRIRDVQEVFARQRVRSTHLCEAKYGVRVWSRNSFPTTFRSRF